MAKKKKDAALFYDLLNKPYNEKAYRELIMSRLFSMIDFNDDFKNRFNVNYARKYLLENSKFLIFGENANDLHMFSFSYEANLDEYGEPMECRVENSYKTSLTGTYTRGVNCEPVKITFYQDVIFNIVNRYAKIFTEMDVTADSLLVNMRSLALVSALDTDTKGQLDAFFNNLRLGENTTVVDYDFMLAGGHSSIQANPLSIGANTTVKQFIELLQYYKASCWNDLGINANFNMKREALNSSESALNVDALLPLTDHIIEMLNDCLNNVNKLYGTNFKCFLKSSWANVQEEATPTLDDNKDIIENKEGEVDNATNEPA